MTREIECSCCKGTGVLTVADIIDVPPAIVQDDGVCGGQPRIEGTRITVDAISGLVWNRGLSPRQIAHLYPELSEAHVQVAIDFWQASLPSADGMVGLLSDESKTALTERIEGTR